MLILLTAVLGCDFSDGLEWLLHTDLLSTKTSVLVAVRAVPHLSVCVLAFVCLFCLTLRLFLFY